MPLGRLQCLYYKAYKKFDSEEGRKEIASKEFVDSLEDTIQGGKVPSK